MSFIMLGIIRSRLIFWHFWGPGGYLFLVNHNWDEDSQDDRNDEIFISRDPWGKTWMDVLDSVSKLGNMVWPPSPPTKETKQQFIGKIMIGSDRP